MRLPENRIQLLAREIIKKTLENKYISLDTTENDAFMELSRLIINDLKFEDRIDEEVRQSIKKMKEDIPEGSNKYQAIFRQLKQQIAQKYNYIL